jgi:hypothetical protein
VSLQQGCLRAKHRLCDERSAYPIAEPGPFAYASRQDSPGHWYERRQSQYQRLTCRRASCGKTSGFFHYRWAKTRTKQQRMDMLCLERLRDRLGMIVAIK